MPFDEFLAARIRDALARTKGVEEKKMFGCICFLLNGNVLAGVWKDRLIVRLGPDEGEAALREPHVRAFDITGNAVRLRFTHLCHIPRERADRFCVRRRPIGSLR
jgi:hypothetical protein